jgi:hypothetical protein
MVQRLLGTLAVGTLAQLLLAGPALAQTGDGGLRGYVKDEHGGALPGATVTAAGPELLRPVTAVADDAGYYRLVNLKPGTYTIITELPGFAKTSQPGILIRAGGTFALDVTLKVGGVEDAITVVSESPMLEISKPSNVLNFDGVFQQQMPIAAKRNWSDFLELTPGVLARPFDDGSGRMVYFGHGTEHFAHVVQLEGAIASNYYDAQVTYVGMGADMIQDVQVKTGGVDASTPMGTGLAMNVVTKSGGNQLKGSVAYAYQPLRWNSDNVANCTEFKTPIGPSTVFPGGVVTSCDPGRQGGTPTTSLVRQLDASLGGPLVRDKIWFFGAVRKARSESGISRTAEQVQLIRSFFPEAALFNNYTDSWQPYLKITARLGAAHELSAFYQKDRLELSGDREYNYEPIQVQGTGGSLYGVRLQSIWGSRVTSTFTASYNDKSGNDVSTLGNAPGRGPQVVIHRGLEPNAGVPTGNGRVLEGGNLQSLNLQPSSMLVIRGDLTYFKPGWIGTHEFQTGFFAAPRNRYDQQTEYFNDGFVLEERYMRDPGNPAAGLAPFHRRYQGPVSLKTREAHDRDLAFYVQDTWRPTPRLVLNLGVRADFVRRFDGIFDVVRQQSTEIGPRFGFSYMVTADARNVLRGSFVRVHEQVMGRDAVTLFGDTARAEQRDLYDGDGDGNFEREVSSPANTAAIAAAQFDPDLHQPFVDELILGFRKQLPWQISVDVAGIHRTYKDTYAEVDINGFWPSAPGQPFGGFGRVDPARGIIPRQTNNTWMNLNYRAIELTVAKNFSKGFQFVGGFNRQWQHYSGTWNPTSNAAYIQPDAFPSHKLLYHPRGNQEDTPLPLVIGDNDRHYGPTWQKYSLRLGATWNAPGDIQVGSSFTMTAGAFSGPITDLLPVNDPEVRKFGPDFMPNGQRNPLSTRLRYVRLDCASPPTPACFATREEQVLAPPVKVLGLRLAKVVKLGGSREVELAGNVFNLLNEGNYTQFSYSGAGEKFNRNNFLSPRNQQPARSFQLTGALRF